MLWWPILRFTKAKSQALRRCHRELSGTRDIHKNYAKHRNAHYSESHEANSPEKVSHLDHISFRTIEKHSRSKSCEIPDTVKSGGTKASMAQNILLRELSNSFDMESLETLGRAQEEHSTTKIRDKNLVSLAPASFFLSRLRHPELKSCQTFVDAWNKIHEILRSSHNQTNILEKSFLSEIGPKDAKKTTFSEYDAAHDLADLSLATQKSEILSLLTILPKEVRAHLFSTLLPRCENSFFWDDSSSHFFRSVIELYMHVGQKPRLSFGSSLSQDISLPLTTRHIDEFLHNLRSLTTFHKKRSAGSGPIWGTDLRLGVPGTLHRIGVYLDKSQLRPLGYTIRFGRYIPGAGTLVADLMKFGSVIIVAPPCCGKTTILRDAISQMCNSSNPRRVVVVDTSNEIIGDSDEPAPYFGAVRRLQVPERKMQSEVLIQAVQNHSPEVVVVDEIGNTEECEGICSIIHRGSGVLCSVHGSSLASVVRNLKLNVLFGSSQPLLLSYEEKRAKQKLRKTALERMNPIGFHFAIQLKKGEYSKAVIYTNLDSVVDRIYDTENWTSGGTELGYEVDLTKPLKMQDVFSKISKFFKPGA